MKPLRETLAIEVVDHDGWVIPCNSEAMLSERQREAQFWLVLHLLLAENKGDESVLPFVKSIVGSNEPVEAKTPHNETEGALIKGHLSGREFIKKYDSVFGDPSDLHAGKLFAEDFEQYTLYKVCRWASEHAHCDPDFSRRVLGNLRYTMDLHDDHRGLLISTAIKRQDNKMILTNREKSLVPILALSMKILQCEDSQFTQVERAYLHRTMLNLGVQKGEVGSLPAEFKKDAKALVAMIDPADHELALTTILQMAILDQKISPGERRILDDVLTDVVLAPEQLSRIKSTIELDTGARVRLDRGLTIDYRKFS